MATTITLPALYSSVKESVIFEIDRDIDAVAEVMINGYLKQMPKNAYKVNVAQYFRDDFTIAPLDAESEPTLQVWDGVDLGRVVNASITVDSVPSEEVPLLCADKQPAPNHFMSDLRRRNAMPGQIDELPVYATTPAVVVYGSVQVSVPAGISCVGFRIPTDAPPRFAVDMRSPDGEVQDRIEYEIEENDGVRLAWINAYGQIDYWNFAVRRKSSTKVTKEKIYTEAGYTATSMQADTTKSVTSCPLPETQANVLSQIFVSESVWCIVGDMMCPIDITTESITTYDVEKLSSVQIEYRNKIR